MKTYYVYILTNERQTLYIGITSDLIKRVYQHKTKEVKGFTEKYNIDKLVYYEETSDVRLAIEREKKLKKWKKEWKIKLINDFNPAWEDLYKKINC